MIDNAPQLRESCLDIFALLVTLHFALFLFLLTYLPNQTTQISQPTMVVLDDGFEALLEPFYNGKKLTDPISTREDKFQLLPAFLKVKGEWM